jgi:predicted transcriptional regulator
VNTGIMAKNRVDLTESEWSVIKAVWQHEPCSAPLIQAELEEKTGWTYSTVRTLMDRMVAKGLLTAVKTGKVTHYRSGITREQAQRSELLYALKHAFNNALSPMVQFLLDTGELSAAELDTLESMIKSKRKGKRKAGR